MAEITRVRLDKQIQKAPKVNMFPLSDNAGELQFVDINGVIKAGETLTRLNSVEINAGNLIIKYTAEDGNQQIVSTQLNFPQQDIKVTDAKLVNPSAGVYRLLITENDGTVFPVDLSALVAVVTQNTEYFLASGDGTPQSPVRIDPTDKFWQSIPRVLDQLDDVVAPEGDINAQIERGGTVVLVWDMENYLWKPRSVYTLTDYKEITETFRSVRTGNTVTLTVDPNRVVPESVKVYRNGLRQDFGQDYEFGKKGEMNIITFYEPFTDKYPERVIVDYRINPAFAVAA